MKITHVQDARKGKTGADWERRGERLALLATGNPEYLPRVKELAVKIVPQTMKIELRDGMVVWGWGYMNVFLCENYQVTRGKEVLPGGAKYTTFLAQGQSMYGTFGHGTRTARRRKAARLYPAIRDGEGGGADREQGDPSSANGVISAPVLVFEIALPPHPPSASSIIARRSAGCVQRQRAVSSSEAMGSK